MSEKQNAVQAGAAKAALVCFIISAGIILLMAWYLEWEPYYKIYGALGVTIFIGAFGGWAKATDDDETNQAIKEMNERDRERG